VVLKPGPATNAFIDLLISLDRGQSKSPVTDENHSEESMRRRKTGVGKPIRRAYPSTANRECLYLECR